MWTWKIVPYAMLQLHGWNILLQIAQVGCCFVMKWSLSQCFKITGRGSRVNCENVSQTIRPWVHVFSTYLSLCRYDTEMRVRSFSSPALNLQTVCVNLLWFLPEYAHFIRAIQKLRSDCILRNFLPLPPSDTRNKRSFDELENGDF